MTGFATGSVRTVWLGLALTCAAVEAVLAGADAGLWGTVLWRPLAYQHGGFWAGLLHGWTPNYAAQPWAMFITCGFLHAGWQHLAGNLLALGWLGLRLETALSARAFAALYGLSLLGGGAATAALATSPRPVVGASGAIMGLIAVWIAAEAQEMAAEGESRARIRAMILFRVTAVAALNWLAWKVELGGLAWQAHLGGFVLAGLAMAALPGLRPRA